MAFIKKVEYPEIAKRCYCMFLPTVGYFDNQLLAPGSIWECDACKKRYLLEQYYGSPGGGERRWKSMEDATEDATEETNG